MNEEKENSHEKMWRKNIPGKEAAQEVGVSLMHSRNNKKISVI